VTVVVVSWILTLLAVFSLAFGREVRTDVRLSHQQAEAAVSRSLALSGVDVARELIRRSSANEWDAPSEGWDQNPELREIPLGPGSVSLGYPSPDGTRTVFGIRDEERRIPWVALTDEILARIPGLSPDERRIISARSESGPAPTPRELLALPELSAAGALSLGRYVTAEPSKTVNINTASLEILRALGIPRSGAKSIVAHRNGPDRRPGTDDDAPFTTLSDPEGGLGACRLDSEAAAVVSALARTEFLAVQSEVFVVSSRGWLTDRRAYCEINAVLVRVAGGSLQIVDWSERWKS